MNSRVMTVVWWTLAIAGVGIGLYAAVEFPWTNGIDAPEDLGIPKAGPGTKTDKVGDARMFWTRGALEMDKCAAGWVIDRFSGGKTIIRFQPPRGRGMGGRPFDVPGSRWSRQPSKCTTEVILESLELDDPALRTIASYARVAELARWQLDEFPEAREHYYNIQAITDVHSDPYEAFGHVAEYLDELYAHLSAQEEQPKPDDVPAPAVPRE